MTLKVGTFNLNNLFSRFNFQGIVDKIKKPKKKGKGERKKKVKTEADIEAVYRFSKSRDYKIRTYKGRLVKGKPLKERRAIAGRIKAIDVDVLAVQEVEDIETLARFARDDLEGAYRYHVLVEGNDPRLIDVGVLSKLPVGAVTSWRHAAHVDDPTKYVFGRDLLQVEILREVNGELLFTLFNNHLKSHYVDWRATVEEQEQQKLANDNRRRRQAEMIARIISNRVAPGSPFIVLGDMNDPPDSEWLSPLTSDAHLGLTNALADAQQTESQIEDEAMPDDAAWTYRHKESGQPATYSLYDQIWLSRGLASVLRGSWIHRRVKLTGDGSDHDPAWVELETPSPGSEAGGHPTLRPDEEAQWHELLAGNSPMTIIAEAKKHGCTTAEAAAAWAFRFAEEQSHLADRPNDADKRFIEQIIKRTFLGL